MPAALLQHFRELTADDIPGTLLLLEASGRALPEPEGARRAYAARTHHNAAVDTARKHPAHRDVLRVADADAQLQNPRAEPVPAAVTASMLVEQIRQQLTALEYIILRMIAVDGVTMRDCAKFFGIHYDNEFIGLWRDIRSKARRATGV